jgi:hypothetical protein
MHLKLNDITDKQFSLNQLSEIYKIPQSERNSSTEDAYKTALLFLKLKSRLELNKPIVGWVYDFYAASSCDFYLWPLKLGSQF